MTLEELRERLIAERRREDKECVNLIRRNDDLREENLRLQAQRSRSATRSRSRTSRSSSRQSQSNRTNVRREQTLGNIDENLQVDDNLQEQRDERRTIYDRYEKPREHCRRQEDQRNNRFQDAAERHHPHRESDNDEEDDPEQERIILRGRQILRDQYERE
ncbi:glutamic acid-rich protein-like [Papaver somniferum]|uniref:glutamic acid-rich protein-like n=1 Tax=Papaver somniferum TaxID=3469 RepID=UPI000E6F88E8|nr:glutamic acid-rich protein-like [Papaver somniferum]